MFELSKCYNSHNYTHIPGCGKTLAPLRNIVEHKSGGAGPVVKKPQACVALGIDVAGVARLVSARHLVLTARDTHPADPWVHEQNAT